MSLAHLAQNMAAHGRNGDTMLMHVTPDEVQNLQGAAMAKGGSLTVNPHTGLPEANFLSDLNPVHIMQGRGSIGESGLGSLVIGAALASMGIPPMYAGLMTGGATAVLTGDLQKGLFAGMGAYGGAGLMGGLGSLGAETVADQAINSGIDAQLSGVQQVGGPGLETGVQSFTSPEVVGSSPVQLGGPDMAQTVVPQPSPIAADKIVLPQTTTAAPGLEGVGQRLSDAGAGLDRLTSKGGLDALSGSMGGPGLNNPTLTQAGLAAGAGFLGGMTQKNPAADAKKLSPGYIRPFNYDPYGQRYTAQTPIQADQFGSRSFNAADGGIVALAHGGAVQHFDEGGYTSYTPEQINNYFAQNPTVDMGAAIKEFNANPAAVLAARTSANAAEAATVPPVPTGVAAPAAVSATPAYNHFTNEQMASYFANPANANVNVADAVKQFNADPNAVNQFIVGQIGQYKDPTATENGPGYLGAYQNLTKTGMTPAEFAAAASGMNKDWGKGYWNQGTVTRAYDIAGKILAFDPQTDKVTPSDKEWVAFMDSNKLSVDDISRATGLNSTEVQRRYDAAKEKPVVKPPPGGGGGGGSSTGTTSTGKVVDLTTPGDITKNANGTVTVAPNLPGGGNFTGVGDVTDRYTAGGGSTGYVPKTPTTAAEHDAMYNTTTGGSRSALDYLTGKAPYSPVPYTPTGEIMKPYSESVLGVQPDNSRFAQRFNPTTRKYEANPDYKAFNFNQDTGQTNRGMNKAELKEFVADPKNLEVPTATTGFIGKLVQQLKDGLLDRPVWMAQNNVSYEQLAASLGISVAEAKKRYPVNKASDAPATPETPVVDTSGGANGGLMPDDLRYNMGGITTLAGGGLGTLGGYSDGGRLLRGPGDGVSDSIPASIGDKQPARLADGEFVVPARIVSELGNGSTEAGARKLYQMMDRVQKARGKTTGKGKVAANSRSDKYLPA
jgi:hypothetical protein